MIETKKYSLVSGQQEHLPLVFGSAAIAGAGGGYSFGDCSEQDAIDLLHEAFDSGVAIYDSAPIYGFREAEKRLGAAFKNVREKVFLVSKCGVSWHSTKRVNMTNDPKECLKMLENTLRDFGSSYVDLYMLHWPDERVDIRYSLEPLVKAKEEGKIRHIGLCNTHREDFDKAKEVAPISVLQGEWSPVARQNLEMRKLCLEEELSWMSWGPLDKGILTARVTPERKFAASDCRSWAPWWKKQDKQWKFQLVDKLKDLLEVEGYGLLDFAVAFQKEETLTNFAIYGTRDSGQLQGLLKSYKKNIPADLMLKATLLIDVALSSQANRDLK